MELILNTFGTSLNRDNEGFVITNKDGRQRVPTIGIKTIQIGKGTQVTSDAIMLAIENEIDVIFTDRQGTTPCCKILDKTGMLPYSAFDIPCRPAT